MTAQDIPAALRWDVSHAKRTLRTPEAAPFLRDALRLESQSRRPRKRLLAWLTTRILTTRILAITMPQAPSTPSTGHGGARAGAGRDPAPYKRKNVTIELPEPLLDKWDAHCLTHHLSRAESLAKWLKWKKPGKKK